MIHYLEKRITFFENRIASKTPMTNKARKEEANDPKAIRRSIEQKDQASLNFMPSAGGQDP